MALSAGTVTVDEDLVATGSGLALVLYNARIGTLQDVAEDMDESDAQAMLQAFADQMVAEAEGLVEHVTDNAEVTVTVSATDAGLQRTPSPNDPSTATVAPAGPVELATKGTVA